MALALRRLLCASAVLVGLPVPGAQTEVPLPDPEGPLRNDTFQPVAALAQEALLRGDRAHARAVQAGAARTADWTRTFEAWLAALSAGGPAAAVAAADAEGPAETLWADPDGTLERRTEGVAYAVLRRLDQIGPEGRRDWRERFTGLAAAALEAAGTGREELAQVEHRHPLTAGAARAALRLADLAFESGDPLAARTWLGRAAVHARELGEPFEDALAARRAAVERLAPALRPTTLPGRGLAPPMLDDQDAAWRTASTARLEWSERLEGRRSRVRGELASDLGRGVQTGLVFLDDGSLVVQSPEALVRWIPQPGRRPPQVGRFALGALVDGVNVPYASDSSGGWPLLPATDGREVVVVAGRASVGGGRGNGLVCLRFVDPGAPAVIWGLGPETWRRPDGSEEPLSAALGDGRWEFQPGPALVRGRVLVLARQVGRDASAGRIVLLALDLADGAPRWSQVVTRAADLRPDGAGMRFVGLGTGTPAQPLALVPATGEAGVRVFAGTNVGLGNLYDVADGRPVWSLRCRRRLPEENGWPGSQRPLLVVEAGVPELLWAAFDSDFLYRLRAVRPGAEGLFARPPIPIGAALGLVAADEAGLVAFARDGVRRAVAAWPTGGEPRLSLALARGERFAGTGLASSTRTWVASDRHLYLFDRTRDHFLLWAAPLADPAAGAGDARGVALGGGVYGRGERVYVVGADALWSFRVEG